MKNYKRIIKFLTWEDQLTLELILIESSAYNLREEVKILAKKYLKNIKYNHFSIIEIYQKSYNELIK